MLLMLDPKWDHNADPSSGQVPRRNRAWFGSRSRIQCRSSSLSFGCVLGNKMGNTRHSQ